MHVDGKCHCGKITFEAEIDPELVGLCNCTDCQTLASSPFRWVAPSQPGTFKLLTGTPRVYVKTAESGAQRPQGFCPDCGTALYATSTAPEPKVYSLRVGAIAQRNRLTPKRRGWMRSAQGWLAGLASIPGTEK